MASERGMTLMVLYEMCKHPDLSDDLAFTEVVVQTMDAFGMTIQRVADGLRVSRSAVSRWRMCKNLPYRPARQGVYDYFRRALVAAGIGPGDDPARLP